MDFLAWISDIPLTRGMSEIQAERSPYIDFHHFPLSIDKNDLIFSYWLLRNVATPGTMPMLFWNGDRSR